MSSEKYIKTGTRFFAFFDLSANGSRSQGRSASDFGRTSAGAGWTIRKNMAGLSKLHRNYVGARSGGLDIAFLKIVPGLQHALKIKPMNLLERIR